MDSLILDLPWSGTGMIATSNCWHVGINSYGNELCMTWALQRGCALCLHAQHGYAWRGRAETMTFLPVKVNI